MSISRALTFSGLKAFYPALVLILVVLNGCGVSKPARFYTLSPVKSAEAEGTARYSSPDRPVRTIGIFSVEIPDYLDRAEIVTRTSTNELEIAEFDKWGGDLRDDISRVLAERITSQYSGSGVSVTTGRRAIRADYRITVNVTRFDPVPKERLWLRAHWAIAEKNGRVLMNGESNIHEPIIQSDYHTVVSAMSTAVGRLGTEISAALLPLMDVPES